MSGYPPGPLGQPPGYPSPGPYSPGRTLYPVPHASRLTPDEWRRRNAEWRHNRPHPHGVPEHYPWGTVMWAPDGSVPLGLVVADPGEPVEQAHAVARELGADHLASVVVRLRRPMPRRSLWTGVAVFVPVFVPVASVAYDGLGWLAGGVAGSVAGTWAGRRQRIRRKAWRHVQDSTGACELFPHLRWLSDLVDEIPDQAGVVWSGVREILWHAPRLGAAAHPVEQVARALARTAAARRTHESTLRDGLPDQGRGGGTDRIDDIATQLVGSLGFEEEVYRRLVDEHEAPAAPARPDAEAQPGSPPDLRKNPDDPERPPLA